MGDEDVVMCSERWIANECSVAFITACHTSVNSWLEVEFDIRAAQITELMFVPGEPPSDYEEDEEEADEVHFGNWFGFTFLGDKRCALAVCAFPMHAG